MLAGCVLVQTLLSSALLSAPLAPRALRSPSRPAVLMQEVDAPAAPAAPRPSPGNSLPTLELTSPMYARGRSRRRHPRLRPSRMTGRSARPSSFANSSRHVTGGLKRAPLIMVDAAPYLPPYATRARASASAALPRSHAPRVRVRRRSRSRLLRRMLLRTTDSDAPSCTPTPRRHHSSSGAARAARTKCSRSAAHHLGGRGGRAPGQCGRSGSQPADAGLCLCARLVQCRPAAHGSPAVCRGLEPRAASRRRAQPDLRSRRCAGTRCRGRLTRPVAAAADAGRVCARRAGHARWLARGVLPLQPAAARAVSGCDRRRPHVRRTPM